MVVAFVTGEENADFARLSQFTQVDDQNETVGASSSNGGGELARGRRCIEECLHSFAFAIG